MVKMNFYCFIVLFVVWESASANDEYTTDVCVKKKASAPKNHPIRLNAVDFKDLVQHSDIYVDKSLLVKAILEKEKVISLTYPKKWGKTVNIDMLRNFFKLEVNFKGEILPLKDTWAYKYFVNGEVTLENGEVEKLNAPPLISKHKEITDKYLGRYPVVYVDFAAIKPVRNDLNGFFRCFQAIISDTFREHEYLLEIYDKYANEAPTTSLRERVDEEKKKFLYFMSETEFVHEDTIEAIQFLCKALHKFFGKAPFVFINEYDYLALQLLFNKPPQELYGQQIHDFVRNFFVATLKANKYLGAAVLTGILSVPVCELHPGHNHITNYNMLNKNMHPFYGFTGSEVDKIFSHLKIPADSAKQALNWHNGYRVGEFADLIVYKPQSIVKFANKKRIENDWLKSGKVKIFSNILNSRIMNHTFEDLIGGSSETKIHRRDLTLTYDDIAMLEKVFTCCTKFEAQDYTRNIIMTLLYAFGYLTLNANTSFHEWAFDIPIKFVNKEVETEIVHEMKIIYRNAIGVAAANVAEATATSLIEFIEANGAIDFQNSDLKKDLEAMYEILIEKANTSFLSEDNENVHTTHFLVLLYIKLKFKYYVGLNVLYYDTKNQKQRPYMVLEGNGHGVLIDFVHQEEEFDASEARCLASDAVADMKTFINFFDKRPVKEVQIYGISVPIDLEEVIMVKYVHTQ